MEPADPLETRLRRSLRVVADATVVPANPAAPAGTSGADDRPPADRPSAEPVPLLLDPLDGRRRRAASGWRLTAAAALVALVVAVASVVTIGRRDGTSFGSGGPATTAPPSATAPATSSGAVISPPGSVTPEPPVANVDHWHAAYGIYVCDHFLPDLVDARADAHGIHSHGDGIIHVHPFDDSVAGRRATLGAFADQIGLGLGDTELRLPDGTTYRNGDPCPGGQPMALRVATWKADQASAPAIATRDPADVRISEDRMVITIAMVPEGVSPPPPPSVPTLDQLSDVAPPAR